jgi:lipoprotein-releasing system permease protein
LKLAFYIARRYLVSKKSVNVINIISGVSVAGVCIGTLALVIVLSVMNGISLLIATNFSSFDPDLKITPAEGKSFLASDDRFDRVKQLPEVASFTETIEENALLVYNGREYPATVKGVPDDYDRTIGLDSAYVTEGDFVLNRPPHRFAVVGQGIAWYLSLGVTFTDPVKFYAPKKGKISRLNLNDAFNYDYLFASGVFSVHQEVDSKYILVPFGFARELFQMENRVSTIEVQLKETASLKKVQKQIETILGDDFEVKDQYAQHELIFKVMQSEKWYIVLILGFILVIASFNILSSLSMLIIDKKQDVAILQSMGAETKLIRRIFLFEGWLISLSGAVAGIILGMIVVWLQTELEFLKLPGADGTYIMSAYPVQLQIADLFIVFFLVAGIGFLASWYPVRYISGKYLSFAQE